MLPAMAKTYDPRRNIEAVSHFLEVVNAPDEPEESAPALARPSTSSAAAIELLRTLRDQGSAPLDEAMYRSHLDVLTFSEALTRMQRAGLVDLLEGTAGKHEMLTLTPDGQRVARLVDSLPSAHAV